MSPSHGSNARFSAFASWNFRVYFTGQLLSTIGTWMQTLAQSWLVLELTDRSDRLGIMVALQFTPLLVFGALAGVLADRFENRRLLVLTSAMSGLLAFALGLVVATDHVTIWWIYGFALALGLVMAVERPTMQAIVFQLVGRERLASAIGINGTILTTGRLLGPGLAGLIIARFGLAPCFFVNAASYLVVIAALILLRSDELVARPRLSHARGQLTEGLRYVRAHGDVMRSLVVMVVVGLVAYNFQTTMPSIVKFEFGRDAGSVGAVLSISAIGSVFGGLLMAGITPHPRRTLALASAAFGVTLLGFAAAPEYGLFVAVSVPVGVASACFTTANTAVLQRATDPAMQGRVMGLHQIAWQGTTPIGALFMGWLIESTSARVPFYLGGLAAIGCAIAVTARSPSGSRRRRDPQTATRTTPAAP
jgi:MFS family permease